MIKDNQKTFNKLNIIIDAFVIIISYYMAYYLRFHSFIKNIKFFSLGESRYYTIGEYAGSLIFLVPIYLIIYYFYNLYEPKRGIYRAINFYSVVKANTLGIAIFTFLLYFKKEGDYARIFLFLFYIANIALSFFVRFLQIKILHTLRNKDLNLKHVILVGYSRATERYIDRILSNPQWGYFIHGILDNSTEVGSYYKKIPIIGNIDDLEKNLATNSYDEVAITLSIEEYALLEGIVGICEKSGIHTKFIPDYNNIIPTRPHTEDLNGLPVINIRHVPLNKAFNSISKRCFDIVGALLALLIFAIPMIATSIVIKATCKGPLIFSQVRIGKGNKEFKMYKFRSMTVQSKKKEEKAWTTSDDPRVTPIGKFLRKTSIDELPQIFNVLKGDMSLIGPRPERPFFVEKFKEEIPRYMIKHQVRPGITGWAQVNGYRGDTSIYKRIDHDLYYIENWNMALDIRILFLTIFKGFINKNAY